MHAGSIQVRLLGILAIGVICSLIACSGGAGPATVAAPGPSTPVALELNPSSSDVSMGDSISITASVSGSTDTSVTWSVDGIPNGNASVGTISGSGNTVTYTAPDSEGTHTIIIVSRADATKNTTATIRIRPPKLAVSISLSPATATVAVGASQLFTATVSNASVTTVTWTLDGMATGNSTAGTLSGSGSTITYTAPAGTGSHLLVATSAADPSKSASSAISVFVPATVTAVAVSPASLNLTTGAQNTFTATVTGTGSFNPGVTWSAQRGSITTTGLYTAPSTGGSDTVTAASVQTPTRTASATIAVAVPNTITSVAVSPPTLSLSTNTQSQFTATVTGTGAFSPGVNWTAQRGGITAGGLYTAPATVGTDVVTAVSTQDPTKSAASTLTVAIPNTVTSVAVAPGTLGLNTGTQQTFTSTVTGTGTYSPAVTWTAQRGTITSAGLYTAPTTAGSDAVTATSVQDATKAATANLTVTVPITITSVVLSPSTLSLNTGTPQAFTSTVTGTGTYSSAVTWTAQRGTITIAGLYTAPTTAGNDTVTATSVQDTSKTATASLTVTAPPTVTAVAVSPSVLASSAGGQSQFAATVTGTGAYSSTVTWSAQRGAITSAGLYTAPDTGGSDVVTATSVQDVTRNATANVSVTSPASVTSVVVSPGTLTVAASSQTQLTATVTGTGSYLPDVTWSAQQGSITSTGLYSAPASGGTDMVTATSTSDPTKSSFALITVQAPVSVAVSLSPSGTVQTNALATLSFTSTVTGSTNTATTWTVDGIANGNATVGTLIVSGGTATYTAPSTAGTHTLTATSVADPTKSSMATLIVNSIVTLGPLAAFPGCEGMGCGATGGRGGVVYTVNTLSDTTNPGAVPWNGPNGPTCSLRDAMLKSGPRTIVFSVGGTIVLHSAIYPVPPNLTIAGQTAPGGGIQITGDGTFGSGGSMIWIAGNTILQYLRIRPGNAPLNTSNQGLTGITISMPAPHDVVIDHCSFEWDSNKAVGWWSETGVQRNTFSWNLEAEGLASHSTGPLVGGYNMGQANLDQSSWDAHHNVLATIDHRLPHTNLKYGRWINNLVFGYNYAVLVRGGTQFDLIGNVWEGTASGIKSNPAKAEVRWADTVAHNENNIVPGGTAKIYMSNNFGPNNPTGTLDNYTAMFRIAASENSQLDNNVVSSTYKATAPTIPVALNGWPITITPLATRGDLMTLLTPTVGAYRRLAPDGSWEPNRDSLDARIIAYILNPATSPTTLVPSAGTLPTLAAGSPIVSSIGDGISDEWKLAHGLSISDPTLANTIRPNAHGFTLLELYLSGLFPNGTPLP